MKKCLEFSLIYIPPPGDYNTGMDAAEISETFRLAMRRWASGVSVVTARAGERVGGMTVSSFTSVALVPPLVLVSLDQASATQSLVRESGYYAVTMLEAGQYALSDQFARPFDEQDRPFENIPLFTLRSGAPLLQGGIAWFDCQVVSAYPAGDHTLYIGQVLELKMGEGVPLLYYQRAYWQLGQIVAAR